jgi:hypothetical protein
MKAKKKMKMANSCMKREGGGLEEYCCLIGDRMILVIDSSG